MKRHAARELALKTLFAYDVGKNEPDALLKMLCEEEAIPADIQEFSRYLVNGVLKNINSIDAKIEEYSREWVLNRMPAVDRNVMRVALFELLFSPEIPKAVIVNEAIEVAKDYGGEDSARFVNGIVGNIIKGMPMRE